MTKIFKVIIFISLIICNPTIYNSVIVSWNSNVEPDLMGYRIHYGNLSGNYPNKIDVGNNTSHLIENLIVGAIYYFAITAYDSSNNESNYSDEVEYLLSEEIPIKTGVILYNNYPNPFNTVTTISYDLNDKDNFVILTVYDVTGQRVGTVTNEYQQKGEYSLKIDFSYLASGIYFYKLNVVNRFKKIKKMVIMK